MARITVVELPNACLTDGKSIRNVCRPFSSPIGTLHIASLLRNQFPEHEVRLYNGKSIDPVITEYGRMEYGSTELIKLRVGTPFEYAEEVLRDTDYLCLSINFTQNARIVTDFAKYAKGVNSDIIVLGGGTDVSTRPEYYLNEGVDHVFIGEADRTLIKFFKGEPGYTGEENHVIRMKTIDDIPHPNNWVPYDYSLVDVSLFEQSSEGSLLKDKKPYQFLVTSQGCHRACDFCTNPVLRGTGLKKIDKRAPAYRAMDNEQFEKWLENAKKAGIKTLGISDDAVLTRLFLNQNGYLNAQAVREEKPTDYGSTFLSDFVGSMTKAGFNIEWPNGFEMGIFYKNPELIKMTLNKNVFRLYWPLEDLSFKEGEKRKWSKLKGWDEELEIIENVAKFADTNYFTLGVIVGFPWDTYESLERVLSRSKFIKAMFEKYGKEAIFRYFLAQPLAGTPNYRQMEKYFVYDIDEHPELISFETTTARTKTLAPHELVGMREEMTQDINGTDYVDYMFKAGQIYFKTLQNSADDPIFIKLPYATQ